MVAATQIAGSFMAALNLGLVLEMPRKYLGWSGLIDGVCWLVHLLVKTGSGSAILGASLASLSVTPMGHLFTRTFRAPVGVFLVPGIFLPVLSTLIYNSVYYIIRNSREEPMYCLMEALQIAGVTALAVFLMDSMSKLIGEKKRAEIQNWDSKFQGRYNIIMEMRL